MNDIKQTSDNMAEALAGYAKLIRKISPEDFSVIQNELSNKLTELAKMVAITEKLVETQEKQIDTDSELIDYLDKMLEIESKKIEKEATKDFLAKNQEFLQKDQVCELVKRGQYVYVNGGTEFEIDGVILDRFELLAMANEAETKREAWSYLKLANVIYLPLEDKIFDVLYVTSAIEITRCFKESEFYYQDLFKKKYVKIRDGKIIDKKSDNLNIPDAWVEKEGEFLPVEVKLKDFDKRALNQLQRYISVYDCKNGIAVAENLTVELPENIEFISFDELER